MKNGTTIMEEGLTYDPIITLCYLPKGVEYLYPHKNLNTDIYSSIVHNCQNLEATEDVL